MAACVGTPKSEVNQALSKAFSEFRQYKGAKVMELGNAANLIKGFASLAGEQIDDDTKKAMDALKDVDELSVVTFEGCSDEDKKAITDKLDIIFEKAEVLMEANDDGEAVRIFGTSKEGTNLVNDVIVYIPTSCTVVCLFGSISLEDLTQMINV